MTPNPIQDTYFKMQKDARELAVLEEQSQLARKSFKHFVPLAWPIVLPSKKFIPGTWHVGAICEHLQAMSEGQIQNLIIIVPPGSGKSTIASVLWSAWMWQRFPGWRSVWASYDDGLSTRDSVTCRDLMKSMWYKETFQPKWKFKSDQDEKTYYYNTEKGFRMSTTVNGAGTGHRGDHLGIDDALSTKARFSLATIEDCNRWYRNVWFNRLLDMEHGTRLVIGQRVADNDLIGTLLRDGGYEVLLVPMEYDSARSRPTSIGWKDPRSQNGELMCPEVFPRHVVDVLKRDADVWATQYQGTPTIAGGGILKSHKWGYWEIAGQNLPPVRIKMPSGDIEERKPVQLPDSFDLVLQSWDCALTDKKTSDYVAGSKIAVRGARRFVLEMVRDHMDTPKTMQAIRLMSGRPPMAHTKLVEAAAAGMPVVDMLRDEIPGLLPVPPHGSKVSRASVVTPDLDAGNWFLPHPMIGPWVGNPESPTESGFMAESVAFPFGANDDMVDSISMGAIFIRDAAIGGLFGVSEKDIRVDDLPIGKDWPRSFALSMNFREVGAIWIARQPDTNQHYLYLEHGAPAGDPTQHAKVILAAGPEWCQGFMHITDEGRIERDGFMLIKKMNNLGVKVRATMPGNDTEILGFAEALRSGKVKVFGSLNRFFDQFRDFKRDEFGRIPSHNAAVVKAALLAWRMHEKLSTLPVAPKPERSPIYQDGPKQGGWML